MKINITENERIALIQAGVITENQNLEMTVDRHLRWIAEAKVLSPIPSVKLLRILHVPEEVIENAIRNGQKKTANAIEKIFEEQTGLKL